jgi:hypothetical protein
MMCQLVAQPSIAEHCPIGETMIRLAKVTHLIVKGWNNIGKDID